MKKILAIGVVLGALFIPLSVTHAQYMGGYYGQGVNYQYPWNNYGSYNWYQNSGNNWYGNYGNNYGNGYNNYYGNNYNNYPQYQPSNLCGPNSTYDPYYNDCDCYSGYTSVNNVCVLPQSVNYSYGYNYNYSYGNNGYGNYPSYGFIKPVAVCNDGTVSYSPIGTCWLNGGVRNLINN